MPEHKNRLAEFTEGGNFAEIRNSGAMAGIERELEKARQSGDEAKEQSLLDMIRGGIRGLGQSAGDYIRSTVKGTLADRMPDFDRPEGGYRDVTPKPPEIAPDLGQSLQPLEPLPRDSSDDDMSMLGQSSQPSTESKREKDAPKAQLERFKAVGEMDFDKVARPPGDPFEYAMKDGKIFVRDTRKDEGFRDVSGIQNEAAIRGVIEKFGKMPADKARAAFAGRDVTKSTPAIEEGMDPSGRRLVLEEERILGTKR